MKKGIETLKEILTANILILIVLFFSIPVSAEVLDKFGGCKSPYPVLSFRKIKSFI